MTSQCQRSIWREKLKHQTGYIGGTNVRVLPDTGCELDAVRKYLVSEDQMHDKGFAMISIDGQANKCTGALIQIDTSVLNIAHGS